MGAHYRTEASSVDRLYQEIRNHHFGVDKRMNKKPQTQRLNCSFDKPKWLGHFALVFTFAISATAMVYAQPVKVWKIGVLVSSSQALNTARDEALRQGLRDLGYEEGKNIVLEYRYGEGKTERLAALARELV